MIDVLYAFLSSGFCIIITIITVTFILLYWKNSKTKQFEGNFLLPTALLFRHSFSSIFSPSPLPEYILFCLYFEVCFYHHPDSFLIFFIVVCISSSSFSSSTACRPTDKRTHPRRCSRVLIYPWILR